MGARNTLSAETVVVGSGPGGAAVARELAARGREVLLVERGVPHEPLGSLLTFFRMLERLGFRYSEEGTQMVRLFTLGGSSVSFCGTAFDPPSWLAERHGLRLDGYAAEVKEELGVAPLPPRLIGEGASLISEAAQAEGLDWRPLPKFIDPDLCDLSCPHCMIGCGKGAKWTARAMVEEAKTSGAQVSTGVTVEVVRTSAGRLTGLRAKGRGGPVEIDAERVVLAAGGMATPQLLQASGLSGAGRSLFADPLVFTYGSYEGRGSSADIPMSCGTTDLQAEGVLLTDLIDPWPVFLGGWALAGPRRPARVARYGKTLSIMTKVRDGMEGWVAADGRVSEGIGLEERRMLERGGALASRILRRAGCDPDTIVESPVRAAHPGGTARIGDVVDSDLQTEVAGLYVCDASVLPGPWGLPPVLTILALAKRLVREKLAA